LGDFPWVPNFAGGLGPVLKEDSDNFQLIFAELTEDEPKVRSRPCLTKEGLTGNCEPSAYCFSQYNDLDDYVLNRCRIFGVQGICCPENLRPPKIKDRKYIFLNKGLV
jgi:hypothetical protein